MVAFGVSRYVLSLVVPFGSCIAMLLHLASLGVTVIRRHPHTKLVVGTRGHCFEWVLWCQGCHRTHRSCCSCHVCVRCGLHASRVAATITAPLANTL